ncbi:MAG: hypothetical protein WA108_02270, partial [Thiobacillus sp.]
WIFSRGKARGGDIAGSMATTSNAAMRKKTPFYVSIFKIHDTSRMYGETVLVAGQFQTAIAGYNLRWLLRAMVRLGLKALLLRPLFVALLAAFLRANPLRQAHPAAGLSLGVAGEGVG